MYLICDNFCFHKCSDFAMKPPCPFKHLFIVKQIVLVNLLIGAGGDGNFDTLRPSSAPSALEDHRNRESDILPGTLSTQGIYCHGYCIGVNITAFEREIQLIEYHPAFPVFS